MLSRCLSSASNVAMELIAGVYAKPSDVPRNNYIKTNFGKMFFQSFKDYNFDNFTMENNTGEAVQIRDLTCDNVIISNNGVKRLTVADSKIKYVNVSNNYSHCYINLCSKIELLELQDDSNNVILDNGQIYQLKTNSYIPRGLTTLTYHHGDMYKTLLNNINKISNCEQNLTPLHQHKVKINGNNHNINLVFNIISVKNNLPDGVVEWDQDISKDLFQKLDDILTSETEYTHSYSTEKHYTWLSASWRGYSLETEHFRPVNNLDIKYVRPGVFSLILSKSPYHDKYFHSACVTEIKFYITKEVENIN